MASKITITLDENGKATIGTLPPGVFCSSVAMPPDETERDVISINTGDTYTVEVNVPSGLLPDSISAVPPMTLESSTKDQAVFSIAASPLPMLQSFGMAMCKVGPNGIGYSLGVIVNPSTLSLAIGIDTSGMWVDQPNVPIGVYCDPQAQSITTWAGGGYSFAFALPPGDLRIDAVVFEPPSAAMPYLISGDELKVWIFNNNTATHSGSQVKVLFFPKSLSGANVNLPPIDPTIINNPINQGGGDNAMIEPEAQYELAEVLAH